MRILLVEPGQPAREAEIGSGLQSMQRVVGGSIEAVYPYEDMVALVCHEEGKLLNLPLNRALRDDDGEIYDIVAGTFFVAGLGEEDFASLSPELMEKYREKFKDAETFARINGQLEVLPLPQPKERPVKPGRGKEDTYER